MDGSWASEPTVEELVAKALAAGAITEEFAEELREYAELSDALGEFYTYIIADSGDPDAMLREWNIIE